MKKLIYILSITCVSYLKAGALINNKTTPDDDKKSKAKREDTAKFVISEENLTETPDTTVFLFPSHDLYTIWDTVSTQPYNFNESFKADSVILTLVNEGDGAFVMPIKNHITSDFGWRRYRPHYGTDIDLEIGDQVVSAFDGMVRLAKYCQGYGNCVIIRHNNGLETVYGHLSKLLVEPGQCISAGSILGLGGNTGRSTGPHLHFEMRYLGQALDTEDFIDYEKGELKSNLFTLRKTDVETKYDLRALHARHKRDVGYAKKSGGKSANNKATKSGYYKIKNGDNLGKIAQRYHTTVKALCKKNGLKPSSKLRAGQRIKV